MSRGSLVRLATLGSIWGSSFLLIKLAIEGVSPLQLVLGRLLAGSLVLLAILAVRGLALPRDPKLWAHLALMGVVANIVPFFLFGWGEQRISSGLAGVLNGATPLFTLALAVAALPEERLSATRLVGLVTGFVGVVLVVGPWDQNPLTSSVSGQLACLLAAACYGVALVYMRRFVTNRGVPTIVLATSQLTIATVMLAASAPFLMREPMTLTPSVVASVVALGALGTGIAYVLFYRLITDAGPTNASMVTYLIPIVAVVLGAVLLGEPVTWNLFVGAGVVILGVALAEGRLTRRQRDDQCVANVEEPPAVAAGAEAKG